MYRTLSISQTILQVHPTLRLGLTLSALLMLILCHDLPAQEGPPLPNDMQTKKLKPLQPGVAIGLVCPASPIDQPSLERAKRYLAEKGYKPVLGKSLTKPFLCDLAGTDSERLDDLNGFIRDPQIRAIMCLRGGYGAMRILDGLDYEALKRDPKIMSGFSDITALHMAIYSKTGLVTFHGPVIGRGFGSSGLRKFTERSFWGMLTGDAVPGAASFVDAEDWPGRSSLKAMAAGKGEGVLIGGNLSLVAALEGTPYAVPRDRDVLLFLEEVGEQAYRVDRMLTQLILAGTFERVRGVLLGAHSAPKGKPEEQSMIDGVLRDRLMGLGVPVIQGAPIGHQSYNMTVAHGANAVLDAGDKSLRYTESFFEMESK